MPPCVPSSTGPAEAVAAQTAALKARIAALGLQLTDLRARNAEKETQIRSSLQYLKDKHMSGWRQPSDQNQAVAAFADGLLEPFAQYPSHSPVVGETFADQVLSDARCAASSSPLAIAASSRERRQIRPADLDSRGFLRCVTPALALRPPLLLAVQPSSGITGNRPPARRVRFADDANSCVHIDASATPGGASAAASEKNSDRLQGTPSQQRGATIQHHAQQTFDVPSSSSSDVEASDRTLILVQQVLMRETMILDSGEASSSGDDDGGGDDHARLRTVLTPRGPTRATGGSNERLDVAHRQLLNISDDVPFDDMADATGFTLPRRRGDAASSTSPEPSRRRRTQPHLPASTAAAGYPRRRPRHDDEEGAFPLQHRQGLKPQKPSARRRPRIDMPCGPTILLE